MTVGPESCLLLFSSNLLVAIGSCCSGSLKAGPESRVCLLSFAGTTASTGSTDRAFDSLENGLSESVSCPSDSVRDSSAPWFSACTYISALKLGKLEW